MTLNSKIQKIQLQELNKIHSFHQNVCESQRKELERLNKMFIDFHKKNKSNKDMFIENWINKYYEEGSDDELGNIDYLTAEAEREFMYTIQCDVNASELY